MSSFSLKTGHRSLQSIRAHLPRDLLTVALSEGFHAVGEWVDWVRFLFITLTLGNRPEMKTQQTHTGLCFGQDWLVLRLVTRLQICRSRNLKLHSCTEVKPHLASTKWLSDAVGAKQLLRANWGGKLYWLKPCFHKDYERHAQLKPFREQLQRRSSPSHRFYHSFYKCDEGFVSPNSIILPVWLLVKTKEFFVCPHDFLDDVWWLLKIPLTKISPLWFQRICQWLNWRVTVEFFYQDLFSGFSTVWF